MGISKTKTEAKLEAIVFFPTWIQVMPLTGIPTWIQLKFACDIFFFDNCGKEKKTKATKQKLQSQKRITNCNRILLKKFKNSLIT